MGLKYSAKHIVNRCAVIRALFTERRQNRFNITLKGLGFGEW